MGAAASTTTAPARRPSRASLDNNSAPASPVNGSSPTRRSVLKKKSKYMYNPPAGNDEEQLLANSRLSKLAPIPSPVENGSSGERKKKTVRQTPPPALEPARNCEISSEQGTPAPSSVPLSPLSVVRSFRGARAASSICPAEPIIDEDSNTPFTSTESGSFSLTDRITTLVDENSHSLSFESPPLVEVIDIENCAPEELQSDVESTYSSSSSTRSQPECKKNPHQNTNTRTVPQSDVCVSTVCVRQSPGQQQQQPVVDPALATVLAGLQKRAPHPKQARPLSSKAVGTRKQKPTSRVSSRLKGAVAENKDSSFPDVNPPSGGTWDIVAAITTAEQNYFRSKGVLC